MDEKKRTGAKVITVRKSTMVAAALAAVLLMIAVGVTVGFAKKTPTAAESVRPNVNISANPTASDLTAGEMSTVELVEAVADTVVEITTSAVSVNAAQTVQTGAGSGVVIDPTGYIITNQHVVDGADNVAVRFRSGTEYPATVIAGDEYADIAVIKIETDTALKAATFGNSDLLKAGQSVIAIGNPLGSLGGTVTEGIISATNRLISVEGVTMNLLQTSAAINPGNSGGGLFNTAGELIGVVNAKSSGSDIEGLGFAIPSNAALDAAAQLMEQGYITGRVDTGLTLVEITDRYTAMVNNVDYLGVYVQKTSSVYAGELQARDYLYSVDAVQIGSVNQLKALLLSRTVGDTLDVVYYRGNEKRTATLTLVQYDPANYR